MDAETFAEKYKLDSLLIPILKHLNRALWIYIVKGEFIDGKLSVKTGFYSYLGSRPSRESYSGSFLNAAAQADYPAYKHHIGKNSARNERVTITILPTSTVIENQKYNQ
jgi:hypothetical protein